MTEVVPVDASGDLDPSAVERLSRIHEEAFPATERQLSMPSMVARAGEADAILRVARSGEVPVGYAYVELAKAGPYAFLWYVAVDAARRDQGIGRRLITDLLDTLRREHPERPLLLFEVHPPEPNGGADPRTPDRRRIQFYRRLGAWWVRGVDYRIPAAGDGSLSLAYDPMFFALDGSFDEAEVGRGIVAMARDSYAGRLADSRYRRLKTSIARMVMVAPGDTFR